MENVSKKDKALELMKQLDIYQPYIDGFKNDGYVCYFERFAGFWDFQNKELEAKRKEIEKNTTALFTPLLTNILKATNCTAFYLLRIIPKNGILC